MGGHSFHPDDEARRVLAAIMEATDDAIVGCDLAGAIVTWNRGAERIYGYPAAEIAGRSIAMLLTDDTRDAVGPLLRRVTEGERVEPYDAVCVTKDGRRIDVWMTVTPIRNDVGAVVGAVITARDITPQRRAERALRRSEARWRSIIESAIDGIIVISQRGIVESFNASAERLFGYRADEVIGQNVSMLMPQPYAGEHDHYLERYRTTGERRIIGIGREVTGRRKNGTTFPIHLSVAEVTLDGETKFTGIVRDLTDRVSLESRIREEAGLVKVGELAAVLAHEVKNPLAAVSGAIQMLREHLTEDDQAIVQEILQRLDGLGRLMSDLLLYARPPRLQVSDIDVAELVRGLVAFFASDPAWQQLDAHVDGAVAKVSADPELLKVAFQNLLLNAAQAMQGTGLIRVLLHENDGVVHVDVIDAGPGIPPGIREKLFTPFFTTKARGTGLGLPTVRRIAEAHGGRVEILESGVGGTTVRVTLRAAR